MRKSFACCAIACCAIVFVGLVVGCQDTIQTTPNCATPSPSSTDTLHGQYTWTDNTGLTPFTLTQFSTFQFRVDGAGNPSVFTLRVDTTVLTPDRKFNDLTATYRLIKDTLYVDSIVFLGNNGRNSNVPFGTFEFICTDDSFLFLGGSASGNSFADTVMRISMRR